MDTKKLGEEKIIMSLTYDNEEIFRKIVGKTFYMNVQFFWRQLDCILGMWKGKYQSMDNTKNRKIKRKLLPKSEENSRRKAHTKTWKLH